MLKMVCNRCDQVIGTVSPDSRYPGSKFEALVFDEKTKRLASMCELDLCEGCARELAVALAVWFPSLGEGQIKWNKKSEKTAQ
jgi:hypothetical protein